MEIQAFITSPFVENCYVVEDAGEVIVIDPGEATAELIDALEGRNVTKVVNTHAHIDHVGGNADIVEKFGCELLIHADCVEMLENVASQGQMFGMQISPSPKPTSLFDEGDTVQVGNESLGVFNCPGHAPGHVGLLGDGFVFGGDVLFSGSIGRTDLPGGSLEVLMTSIREKFMPLPDETIVYSGHGPATTIGQERKSNPFILQYLGAQ
ncbi:MAG: MBL fold metallo-hydrolase [Candidatus Hydrogenedentota bacterium]